MEERHVLKNDGVVLKDVVLIVSTFDSLILDSLYVGLKFFLLFVFELGKVTIDEAKILSSERSNLDLNFGVKQELDCALVV